ncbi:MAG TPA: hypothetical protein VGS57_17155 [Thermoanaerobaculia bacterium]|jgi:hypothetical protein|nr:hypothetical protein [Thermoanaerobaculia bacterium]
MARPKLALLLSSVLIVAAVAIGCRKEEAEEEETPAVAVETSDGVGASADQTQTDMATDSTATATEMTAGPTATTSDSTPETPTLVGVAAVTPNGRDQNVGGYRSWSYSGTDAVWQQEIFHEKKRVVIHWYYDGVPTTLTPGQTIAIKVTGEMQATPSDAGDGIPFAGNVELWGDVDVSPSNKQADHGNPVGVYEGVVRPGAKYVKITLYAFPSGTSAVWEYKPTPSPPPAPS